jgi:hypothetical protein
MNDIARLKETLSHLPVVEADGRPHLAYQTVTDLVAAHLFPDAPPDAIDAAAYQRILETAAAIRPPSTSANGRAVSSSPLCQPANPQRPEKWCNTSNYDARIILRIERHELTTIYAYRHRTDATAPQAVARSAAASGP